MRRLAQTAAVVVVSVAALLGAGGCDKAHSRSLMKEGNSLYKAGKLGAALAKFREASKLEPSFALAQLHIGYTCVALGADGSKAERKKRLRCAAAAFKRYMKLKPKDARGPRFYLKALLDSGRSKDARDFLLARHRERPRDVSVVRSLGVVASKEGRFEAALRWYEKRAELEPRDATARYAVGTLVWEHLYRGKGKVESKGEKRVALANRGIKALEQALGLRPRYFEAATYVNLLLRERAKGQSDPVARKADEAAADKWLARAEKLKAAIDAKAKAGSGSGKASTPAPTPAPGSGSGTGTGTGTGTASGTGTGSASGTGTGTGTGTGSSAAKAGSSGKVE